MASSAQPKAPDQTEWEGRPDGTFRLAVTAAALSLRGMVMLVLGMILVGAPLVMFGLMFLEATGLMPGRPRARIAILIPPALLYFLVFLLVFRRFRRAWEVVVGPSGVAMRSPRGRVLELSLSELQHLRVKEQTDYARIEVAGGGMKRTLLVGFGAKRGAGTVPALPSEAAVLLQDAGLEQQQTARAPGLTTWRRQ